MWGGGTFPRQVAGAGHSEQGFEPTAASQAAAGASGAASAAAASPSAGAPSAAALAFPGLYIMIFLNSSKVTLGTSKARVYG